MKDLSELFGAEYGSDRGQAIIDYNDQNTDQKFWEWD